MVDALARESRNSTFLLRQATEADLRTNAAWSEHLTRRALEFDPDNPDVVGKLARMLRTLGRSGEALEFFDLYSRMVPDDFQALGQIGSSLSDLGRFEEAEPFLRRAHQQLDDALTHYNLGAMLSATGRLDEAAAEYQHALERDPSDPDARSNLAAVLVKQGKLGARDRGTGPRPGHRSRKRQRPHESRARARTTRADGASRPGISDRARASTRGLIQAAEALKKLGIRN